MLRNTFQPAATPWLVGDIGGTNARLGWVAAAGGAVSHVRQLAVADHAGPAQALRAYLADLASHLDDAAGRPRAAALALATPLLGDEVAFTNNAWRFSRAALQRELGLQHLRLMNDFEALAFALPHLQTAQYRVVGSAAPSHDGSLAVLGPGTGLGVSGAVRLPAPPGASPGWANVVGEGGHVSLAAADDFEAELLRVVRRRHAHVSAERLLCGAGLVRLHHAIACVEGRENVDWDTDSARLAGANGGAFPTPATPAALIDAALTRGEPAARRTLEVFCALLGGVAGNVALTLGARGGVYIGGGIVPRLGAFFDQSAFRQRFEAKGRFEAYLRGIGTAVITDTAAALGGAAHALRSSI